ncbi:MAG: hypothetical protein PHI35_01310 [Victivallaceae bacterium]|nr:hypothetical protein [Victivallaceae bacterium]
MDRNQLRGKHGGESIVIFAAAGFNFRKLSRAFTMFLCQVFKIAFIQLGKGYAKKFGKGKAREGKNLSSKGFFFSQLAFA